MKRYVSVMLCLLLTVSLFAGCSKGSDHAMENGAYMGAGEMADGNDVADSLSSSTTTGETALPTSQKLVRKLWVTAETEDLNTLLSHVDSQVAALGGYVEAREIFHGSPNSNRRYRNGTLTLRIPAPQVDAFLSGVGEQANIVSSNETIDDITLTYVATQSRITALETEQSRLLELLAQAESMEDLLKIESRLTEVRAELEKITSQLLVFDNQVNYGTVYLTLTEVKEYTNTEEPVTVWQRMGRGFMDSLKGLGDGCVELLVFLVSALPYLIPLGGITAGLILWICKKRKAKKTPPAEN